MYHTFGTNNAQIAQYAVNVFKPMDHDLEQVLELGRQAGLPEIHVGPMDGRHIEVLTRAIGAKRAVEIGTLGGYSGTCIARGLVPGGKLYTLEINELNARVAAKAFEVAKVQDKTEIILGPARESLCTIESKGPFDLIFIDADKLSYVSYLRWAEINLRVGGVLLADNTFAFGLIADETEAGERAPSVKELREFNSALANSNRFRATILPTGEGLTFAVKIS
jgi:caffeoyl-CoA O-methyltransferase